MPVKVLHHRTGPQKGELQRIFFKCGSNARSDGRKKTDKADATPFKEIGTSVSTATNATVKNVGRTWKPVEMIDIITCTEDDLDEKLYNLKNSEDNPDEHVNKGQHAPKVI